MEKTKGAFVGDNQCGDGDTRLVFETLVCGELVGWLFGRGTGLLRHLSIHIGIVGHRLIPLLGSVVKEEERMGVSAP